MTVTDAERAKARRVTRPTFDATQPPPRNSRKRSGAPRRRERERAEKAEAGGPRARADQAPRAREADPAATALGRGRSKEARAYQSGQVRAGPPHLRAVARAGPGRQGPRGDLRGRRRRHGIRAVLQGRRAARPLGATPTSRELLEAEANARPCPEVSVCMRMALNKAAKIRRRRAEAEEAAKLALLGQGPAVAATEPGAPVRGTARPPCDVFTQFVYPEAAGAQPVTNTQQYADGREGFSRRGRPPPVPSTRCADCQRARVPTKKKAPFYTKSRLGGRRRAP